MKTKELQEHLDKVINSTLETYSNVHRGSGHKSLATTKIFEEARAVVLDYLQLNPRKYHLIFCSPYSAQVLTSRMKEGDYHAISSEAIHLSVGVTAIAVMKNKLPAGAPSLPGGGTTKLISNSWVIWASAPSKFEPGTPAVTNVVVFASALQFIQKHGKEVLKGLPKEEITTMDLLYNDPVLENEGQELYDEFLKTRIGKDLEVPTIDGAKPYINFDSAASTTTFKPIKDAFIQSLYSLGHMANDVADEVSNICADFFHAPKETYDTYFVSNTTEGINLVAKKLHNNVDSDVEPVVISTILEHSSNDLPWRNGSEKNLIHLGVNDEGFIDPEALTAILEEYNEKGLHDRKRVIAVTISGASNVIGTCNDLSSIGKITHKYGTKLIVDGAQLVAHKPVRVGDDGIDCLVFSGHKIYAPFGSSVVLIKKGMLSFSDEERNNLRTLALQNSAGIVALGKSLHLLKKIGMELVENHEQVLTAKALKGLQKFDGLTVFGVTGTTASDLSKRVGVIAFQHKKILSFRIGKELAARSAIGIRVGCHCAHIIVKHILNVGPGLERFQRVLQTLIPAIKFPGVARVSIGIENTEEDIDALIEGIEKLTSEQNGKEQKMALSAQKKKIDAFAVACAGKIYS